MANDRDTRSRPRRSLPYGAWPSPVSARLLGQTGDVWARFDRPELDAAGAYWLESRTDTGRTVIVHKPPDGPARDLTTAGFDVRTEVHEYGGGAYFLDGPVVFFSHRGDGRIYRQEPSRQPFPVTPEPDSPGAMRYAEGIVLPGSRVAVCVRELHLPAGVRNELVAFPTDGSAPPWPLVSDHDFVAFPCVSPDGSRLAWTTWDLPDMPFIGTDLWIADLHGDGTIGPAEHVAGGRTESIFQPRWSPQGELHFVSDRSGWWNLYRWAGGSIRAVLPLEAELGWPQWFCALSSYDFLENGLIACLVNGEMQQRLTLIDPASGTCEKPDSPYSAVSYPHLRARGTQVIFIAASPLEAPAVVTWDAASGRFDVLARSMEALPAGLVSAPRPFTFRSRDDWLGRAAFYPPANPDVEPPRDETPPLVVLAHGGPTDQASQGLRPEVQFLTSRGIAVVDVDYAGSTGYGRLYAERLRGRWGVADTEDCIDAALHLAAAGEIDPSRIAIAGGSAGGYIVLCTLAFHELACAGVSLYGIADPGSFAAETHKFESGYLDWLIGEPAAAGSLYRERSPALAAETITGRLLIIQGLDDHVVTPGQARAMVAALEQTATPWRCIAIPGEGHGFRRASNIERAYASILGFLLEAFGVAEPRAEGRGRQAP